MDKDYAIVQGDEFAYDELLELRSIQFLDNKVGGDEPAIIEMEVFEEQKHIIDIYSLSDTDRMHVLMREFDNNMHDASRFNQIIKQLAHIRAVFREHKNVEIMVRQLITIGQDPQLLGAILIIPTIQFVSSITFMERLRRQNPQQIVRGRIVRIHKTKKPTTDIKLAVPTSPSGKTTQVRKALTGMQFPHRILANVKLSETSQSLVIVPPNTSVLITEFTIYNIENKLLRDQIYDRGRINGTLHFDCIGLQEDVRTPSHFDNREPLNVEHTIAMDDPKIIEKCARVFNYFALAFKHVFTARATDDIGAKYLHPLEDDFAKSATETIHVVKLEPIHERLIECARALGERTIGERKESYMTLDFTEDTNAIADFIRQSSFELYWQIRYSDIPTRKLISSINNAINMRNTAKKAIEEHKNHIHRLEILAAIIDDNFGSTKVRAISSNTSGTMRTITLATSDEKELLSQLTEKERKYVLVKYNELYSALATIIPCEHSGLVQRLKVAINIKNISHTLEKLEKILEPSRKQDEMLICSLCKQKAVCPHVLEIARARTNRASRQQEKAVLFHYIETIPERKVYYCRVCGEHFEWRFITTEDVEKALSENEEIVALIKYEWMVLQSHIASTAIDKRTFHHAVISDIYRFIEQLEQRISLAQTNVAAELNAKMRIFTAIYIYADCIVNKDKYKVIFDGFIPRDPAKYQIYAIKYAIDKIVSIENVSLHMVPSITRVVIKRELINAVMLLSQASTKMIFEKEAPRDYRKMLEYDPVYHIFYYNCIYNTKHVAKKDLLDPKPQDPRVVYKPLFAHCSKKNPIIALIIRGLELRDFDFPFDTTNRAIIEYRAQRDEINNKIKQIEIKYSGSSILNNIVPTIYILRDAVAQTDASELQISRVYGENGHMHNWTIIVFKNKTDQLIEHPLGAAGAFADTSLEFVDMKCSICGIMRDDLMSGKVKLDEEKITQLLKSRQKMGNFYKFFEIRCPEGDQHVYDGDNCKKCSYSQDKASKFNNEYYEKYVSIFVEYLTVEDDVIQTTGRRMRSDDEYIEKSAQKLAALPWTFNFDLIIKTATLFKLERHVLQALGAHEGLSSAQLNDESFVARVPKTRVDIRIQSLRECLQNIIMIYNITKRIPSHEKISHKTIAIFVEEYKKKLTLDSQRTNMPTSAEDCVSKMPTIGKLIMSVFDASNVRDMREEQFPEILSQLLDIVVATRKPSEIVDFYIEFICKLILAIHDIGTLCATLLSKQIVAQIIERENMMIKSEHYNLSVVEGTKLANEDFDTAIAENILDEGYEEEEQEGDEDEKNPFSLDAFDVDDARGDDIADEDEQPFIHVGDEVGW